MKIVILPGVGYGEEPKDFKLKEKLKKKFSCNVEWFNWKHNLQIPNTTLPLKSYRNWICEVILDFQMAVKHSFEIKVPEADYYIGHSAGSILALVQKKHCVIMGSPAILVESVQNIPSMKCLLESPCIANIIHKYDLLSYPLPFENVENHYVSSNPFRFWNYFPPIAHSAYWSDDKIIDKVVNIIDHWEDDHMQKNSIQNSLT